MPDDAPLPLDERRFLAVLARNPQPDCGPFLYGVVTQGVFCLPGCPSRAPLRRNTRFFADATEASAAGFRACRRCDPLGERAALHREAVAEAARMIEEAETPPSLAELAARAGFGRHHFLRLFRDVSGVTPRAYAEAVRARRLAAALGEGERVADAVAGAGFGSESRVYERPPLGMTPGAARRGGAGERIGIGRADSAMGPLLVGATARGVCFIGFAEPFPALEADLRRRFPHATVEEDPALADIVAAVAAKLREPSRALDLPLDLRGTAFQRRVWEALQAIPPGRPTTYGALAASLGMPRAVRAVASACARNPVGLAVPCHRVVGADGALTGYRWGVANKRRLLEGEA
ncbi:methylated-DNA--[protein]-cysteine S-methyltransferase [Sabulicella glaciei]|uniref:Methylated-DNA--[protein]-cysteine S-methyltransferase n=1 Tax=Sabulicella glaciei TaxID=2984948 RepID=A0ABT3NWW4_9PROT|nr:methylated-DNA--[protein]-cysteine S-methyltransferase [Roseococcus sp. MDT2-1-1]MCW8086623.1 methylated-DNA--[protein]-cysteine S-methyltransferase [Roseococcus sp. MDT2-1-1]